MSWWPDAISYWILTPIFLAILCCWNWGRYCPSYLIDQETGLTELKANCFRAQLIKVKNTLDFPLHPSVFLSCLCTELSATSSIASTHTWKHSACLSLFGASSGLWGRCDILGMVEVKYPFPLTFCLLVVAVPEQPFDLSPLLSWRLRQWGYRGPRYLKVHLQRGDSLLI